MTRPRLIKSALLVLAILLLTQLVWLTWQWLSGAAFGLPYWIWMGVVVLAGIVATLLTIVFRKKIWVNDPQVARAKQVHQMAKAQFRQIQARAKVIDKTPNNTPWYLFLAMQKEDSATVMAELGYVAFGDPISDKELVFTTWTSPTAVAYRIEIEAGADLSFDLLNSVLRLLFRQRPNLAINAAFVEYELASLVQTSAAGTANASTMNRILNVVVENFGVDVPVHVLLSGLNHMPDLARAALLTGHLGGEVIFGGFLDEDEPDVASRVDRLFEGLVKSLNAAQFQALQKQLLPEFSAALLNAPFQLALLQTQLRSRMTALSRALPPRQKALNLQSIVFIGARDGMPSVDPLCQVAGQRFFASSPATALATAEDRPNSVTTENAGLVASAYHREGFVASPNLRRSVQQSLNARLWTFALIGVVGLFGLAVLQNVRAYSAVNNQVKQAFTTYYASINGVPTDSDFLAERVLKLQPIRDGLIAYEPLDARVYRRFLPSPSMKELYQGLYHDELTKGLQTSLISFLEKDIFAYNSVADGVELFHLASVEAQLFADQTKYKHELIEYYSDGLAEEGEVSGVFQTQLRATLDDLFTLNQPPATRNEDLRAVVAKTLLGLDTADLLYASLMRRSDYAERVDLRQLIGPRFFEVFNPIRDAEVYLVPRGYTRVGFDQLFQDGEMPELVQMIQNYETVIGETDSALENAIIRKVAQNYTADYIARWNAFLSALSLRDAADWGDAQILMQALTNTAENPVDRLVAMLASNTDIKVYQAIPPSAEGTEGDAVPEPQLVPASTSAEATTAYNIRTAFRPYLDALRAGQDQQSQFDLFLAYARDVNLWLDAAGSATNGAGAYLFEQYKSAGATNPLAVLNAFVSRSELEIIRSFGQSIASTLDNRAMQYVYDYIDAQWQQQILANYGSNLTQAFPFDPSSEWDFPLMEFTDLFGPEGKLALFEQAFLTPFQAQSSAYVPRPTFLLTGNAELAPNAKVAFDRIRRISEALFVDGKPYLEFGIRTGYMSNSYSKLSVTSGVTLHQFSHGPVVWDKQTWPVAGIQDNDLTLRIFNHSRAVLNQTFQGPWSWFRLAEDGSVALNPSLGVAETVFDLESGTAALQFNAQVRDNPFGPGFFSGFDLPQSLFKADIPGYQAESLGETAETLNPSDSILQAWLRRDPEIEALLIDEKGQDLQFDTRISIQLRLQADGHYFGPIDGIIGSKTQLALKSWRNDQG